MKYQTYAKSNQCQFPVPEGKKVMGVSYHEQGQMREMNLMFVPGSAEPTWHVSSMNGQPENAQQVKDMLGDVHEFFFGQWVWMEFEGELIIWPPAINDGDVLSLELKDIE